MNLPALEPASVPSDRNGPPALPREVRLDLIVRDVEVIGELVRHGEGDERTRYAMSALRLGVLALRQASGVIDSDAVRREGERLVAGVRNTLSEHSSDLLHRLTGVVQQYFDPNTGQLPQRLDRLLKKDGDLEAILSRQLSGDTSALAQTLAKHVGQQSDIFKLLSPKQTDGLLAALTTAMGDALRTQREQILEQFSLDREDSALSRLVGELSDANGALKKDLGENIAKVVKEFSLDNADGALTRLVGRVEKAQATISGEFSLDNQQSALSRLSAMLASTQEKVSQSLTLDDEKSPLYRLRAELLKVVGELADSNRKFQSDVRETLVALQARRAESQRSTRHGGEFEAAVGEFLQLEAQRAGDLFVAVGETVGAKPRCKIGDHTITLGAESAAPGAVIVCEAKERQGYTAQGALLEMTEARENRVAQIGVFIFSARTAPGGIEPLQRHGRDVLVVWDPDDPQTDVFLRAALSIARALVVRERGDRDKLQTELVELERAITMIAKDVERATRIKTSAETAGSAIRKITDEADAIRAELEQQIGRLRDYVDGQRRVTSTAA